jgi:hypothetical protein
MVIRRAVVLTALAFCVLQFSHPAFGLGPLANPPSLAAQDNNFTLEGKITEKVGTKLTVSTGENIIFHVVYNDKTEIKKKDGSPGTGEDLHKGVTISVAGDLAESGEITAKTIGIESDGSGK